MFEDSFLFNLIVFALGQGAAWGYLRTGLVRRGVALMVAGWLLADVALLARFAYYGAYEVYWTSLVLMQLYSLIELVRFVGGRLRRSSARARQRRDEVFRRAFVHYVRNELEPAYEMFNSLLWRDPWDLESKLSLATLHSRRGDLNKARSMFRAARALDLDDRYADLIELELERCQG